MLTKCNYSSYVQQRFLSNSHQSVSNEMELEKYVKTTKQQLMFSYPEDLSSNAAEHQW